jgi:hypothetical protein
MKCVNACSNTMKCAGPAARTRECKHTLLPSHQHQHTAAPVLLVASSCDCCDFWQSFRRFRCGRRACTVLRVSLLVHPGKQTVCLDVGLISPHVFHASNPIGGQSRVRAGEGKAGRVGDSVTTHQMGCTAYCNERVQQVRKGSATCMPGWLGQQHGCRGLYPTKHNPAINVMLCCPGLVGTH